MESSFQKIQYRLLDDSSRYITVEDLKENLQRLIKDNFFMGGSVTFPIRN